MMLDFILSLDKSLFILVNSQWTAPWADQFFPFITDLHKTPFFKAIIVPLVLGLFVWRRGLKKGLLIFFFCILSVLISDGIGNWAFKKTVERPRPANTANLTVQVRAPFGGYSFVSNHATNMFSFAGYTSAMFPPAAVPLYTLATLVAYSRVYNGVHFPTDVICGGLLGLIVGVFFARLCQRLIRKMESEGTATT
ncbi:phosphatase PAP2 family protein [Bdellovibrio sp. 22V]|uniref:phosphatase PAP2 family protein n=1 Tax=Bdellovibrio TaxID=958 RepID=UPI0025434DFF|nr:phosphatase PAP2 family protein [Bdellovibrio sp. 22V]WII70569.1 phosphatase PAP2 family protein [Bdellovibrio sp. 22V]